jgi:hypothetical protein
MSNDRKGFEAVTVVRNERAEGGDGDAPLLGEADEGEPVRVELPAK